MKNTGIFNATIADSDEYRALYRVSYAYADGDGMSYDIYEHDEENISARIGEFVCSTDIVESVFIYRCDYDSDGERNDVLIRTISVDLAPSRW